MYPKKSVFVHFIYVFLAALFLGFFVPNNACPQFEKVYYPKLSSNIATPDAAKKSLSDLMNKKNEIFGISFGSKRYYSPQDLNLYSNRLVLFELVSDSNYKKEALHEKNGQLMYIVMKGITVLDDRIEISSKITVPYADLAGYPIAVEKSGSSTFPYIVNLLDRLVFHFPSLEKAQEFADVLFFIQQDMQKRKDDEQLARFEPVAARYRSAKIKPPVSEAQRKLIVQANALNQEKDYGGAIDKLRKAAEIDPTSYPAAYFNMALIYAQMRRYSEAITSMRQYLMLEPEAMDARSAQDKIYEWEAMIQK